jgi:hypothetical protein
MIFKEKFRLFWEKEKNRRIAIILIVGVILIAFALGLFFIFRPDLGTSLSLDVDKKEAKEQLYPSLLDGTMVSKDDANRHPLGVIVENHVNSRPHSGLSAASVVYEAIAEGGITRFLAIYGPRGAEKVGPVRSARTYYVDWIRELNGYFAHVGGNYDALQQIKTDGILDLDQFANPAAYWRDRSRKVSSEHTMYTSTTKLYEIAANKKYSADNAYIGYKFKTDTNLESRPAAQSISINFGNASCNVKYVYNQEKNSYLREMAGKAHIDAENNIQIEAKNIIIQTISRKPTITAINESGWMFNLVGSGDASVFIDGKEIKATWKKENNTSRTRYYDKAAGTEIEFNPGTFWIETIHPGLTYKVE